MKNNELFIGLDIGTTKIVAMIGHVNEYSKLKIIGLGRSESLEVHRGVVNNITQTIQSIQSAVHEAEQTSGYKIDKVVVESRDNILEVYNTVIISLDKILTK